MHGDLRCGVRSGSSTSTSGRRRCRPKGTRWSGWRTLPSITLLARRTGRPRSRQPRLRGAGLAGRRRLAALGGPVVEAERRRLDAVFAATLAAQCGWGEADDAALAAA